MPRYFSLKLVGAFIVIICLRIYFRSIFQPLFSVESNYPQPQNATHLYQLQEMCQKLENLNQTNDKIQTSNATFDINEDFFASIFTLEHPNCRRFKSYFFVPQETQEEREFPLAFTIVIHKDTERFARLLRMLYRPSNYYCVHIDQRSSQRFTSAIQGLITCLGNNIEIVPQRMRTRVVWGDSSVLKPQLVCAEMALRRPGWRYLINVSGQEFPLRTNLELVAIMKALNNSNLVEAVSIKAFKGWTKLVELPNNMTWFKGSIYGAFRREFLDFLIHGELAKPLLKAVFSNRSLQNQDELCFTTLAYNPHIGAPGACIGPAMLNESNANYLGRLVLWLFHGHICPTKFVRDICILGRQHLPMLKISPHMFANKFHVDVEPDAFDCLELWYFEKIKREHDLGGRYNRDIFNPSLYARLTCSRNHLP